MNQRSNSNLQRGRFPYLAHKFAASSRSPPEKRNSNRENYSSLVKLSMTQFVEWRTRVVAPGASFVHKNSSPEAPSNKADSDTNSHQLPLMKNKINLKNTNLISQLSHHDIPSKKTEAGNQASFQSFFLRAMNRNLGVKSSARNPSQSLAASFNTEELSLMNKRKRVAVTKFYTEADSSPIACKALKLEALHSPCRNFNDLKSIFRGNKLNTSTENGDSSSMTIWVSRVMPKKPRFYQTEVLSQNSIVQNPGEKILGQSFGVIQVPSISLKKEESSSIEDEFPFFEDRENKSNCSIRLEEKIVVPSKPLIDAASENRRKKLQVYIGNSFYKENNEKNGAKKRDFPRNNSRNPNSFKEDTEANTNIQELIISKLVPLQASLPTRVNYSQDKFAINENLIEDCPLVNFRAFPRALMNHSEISNFINNEYHSYWMDCIEKLLFSQNVYEEEVGYNTVLKNRMGISAFPQLCSDAHYDACYTDFLYFMSQVYTDLECAH